MMKSRNSVNIKHQSLDETTNHLARRDTCNEKPGLIPQLAIDRPESVLPPTLK